jgi:hypothetical protein
MALDVGMGEIAEDPRDSMGQARFLRRGTARSLIDGASLKTPRDSTDISLVTIAPRHPARAAAA